MHCRNSAPTRASKVAAVHRCDYGSRRSRVARQLMLLVGAGVVAAVGAQSAAATGWSVQRAPQPTRSDDAWLRSVSCISMRDCMAVGWSSAGLVGDPAPLVEHWDGAKWSIQRTVIPAASGSGGALLAVSCTPTSACVAVGSLYTNSGARPLAERWDGSSWSIQRIPQLLGSDQFNGVSCVSSTDCVAVGYGQDAVRWDGHRWGAQNLHITGSRTMTSIGLTGVSCPSATTCAAVGTFDIVCDYYDYYDVPILGFWTFGRSSLRPYPNPDCSNSRGHRPIHVLNAVSCTSTVACTAVGTGVYRWNGRRWSIEPERIGIDDELNGVSCTSTNACTAVGPDIYSWNGHASSRVPVPRPSEAIAAWLNSVSCTSPESCVAVGSYENRPDQDSLLIESLGIGAEVARRDHFDPARGGSRATATGGLAGIATAGEALLLRRVQRLGSLAKKVA